MSHITPDFYDENGTPRYGPFDPREVAAVSADAVALLLVACQNCARHYRVSVSVGRHPPSLPAEEALAYGDPPPHDLGDDRCVGETMNSVTLEVLEYWRLTREPPAFRERVPDREGPYRLDWCPPMDWERYRRGEPGIIFDLDDIPREMAALRDVQAKLSAEHQAKSDSGS